MNKQISDEFIARAKRCIVEARNGNHFYETTGIHMQTLNSILERGWAKDTQIVVIDCYCDQVEGIEKTDKTAA